MRIAEVTMEKASMDQSPPRSKPKYRKLRDKLVNAHQKHSTRLIDTGCISIQIIAYIVTTIYFQEPPPRSSVSSTVWLIAVYMRDVLMRLDELKAKITSTYGFILKMDLTKKV